MVSGLDGRIALTLTRVVGTMWCAYAFAALALVALPAAIESGSVLAVVQWISQTFIQLVMLSVIMVGHNIIGQAADRRSEMTYKDAEATFHEAEQIQQHLAAARAALGVPVRVGSRSAGTAMPLGTLRFRDGTIQSPVG